MVCTACWRARLCDGTSFPSLDSNGAVDGNCENALEGTRCFVAQQPNGDSNALD